MKDWGELAIRVQADNPDHHLWVNHGTYWCHFTIHLPNFTKERQRISLRTKDRAEARQRRDEVLARVATGQSGQRRFGKCEDGLCR